MNAETWIALGSLAVGVWALWRTRGVGPLERRLRQLEVDRAEREDRDRRSAVIRVYALVTGEKIVLENVGESPAQRVNLQLTPDPIPDNERHAVFPIPALPPGQPVSIVAGFHFECLPPLAGVLTYRDQAGPHSVELRVEQAD